MPRLIAVLSAALLLLAACAEDRPFERSAQWRSLDAAVAHPITVGVKPYQLSLDASPDRPELTEPQRDAARRFLRRFADQGSGMLQITLQDWVPGSPTAEEMRQLLELEGIQRRLLHVVIDRDGVAESAVAMSFQTGYVAQAPECGYWPRGLEAEPRNTPYWNFGCAQQHNLAMMVANPNDLLRPRTMIPASSEHRDAIWKKYSNGEAAAKKSSGGASDTQSSGSDSSSGTSE